MNTTEVWEAFGQQLLDFLRRRVHDPAVAEDLLQDVLLKVHTKLHTVSTVSKLKSWVFQIANHTLLDYYRSTKRTTFEVPELSVEPVEVEFGHELTRCLTPFLAQLDESDRLMVHDIELEGMSQRSWAQHHNLPYSTVKSRVQRTRSQLKGLFDACCKASLSSDGRMICQECGPTCPGAV